MSDVQLVGRVSFANINGIASDVGHGRWGGEDTFQYQGGVESKVNCNKVI